MLELAPFVRRADAHPDAPPRAPLVVSRDLAGEAFVARDAAEGVADDAAPVDVNLRRVDVAGRDEQDAALFERAERWTARPAAALVVGGMFRSYAKLVEARTAGAEGAKTSALAASEEERVRRCVALARRLGEVGTTPAGLQLVDAMRRALAA